jgi:hypothetical protein
MQPGVKSKNCRILPGSLKGQSGKKITNGGPTTYTGLFDFLSNKIKRTGEKMSRNSFCNGKRYKNKVMRNFVTPKSHGIPYTIRNIRNLEKHTEFRISGIPKTP